MAGVISHMVCLDGSRMNYIIGIWFLYVAWCDFRNMLDPNRLTRRDVQIHSAILMVLALVLAYAFLFHGVSTP